MVCISLSHWLVLSSWVCVCVCVCVSVCPGKISFYVCSHQLFMVPTVCNMTNATCKFKTCKNARVESYDDKTFYGDPRPSLWQWRAKADSSHIERQNRLHPRQRKRTSKAVVEKLSDSKLRSMQLLHVTSTRAHAIFVANSILAITPVSIYIRCARTPYADTFVHVHVLAVDLSYVTRN